MAEEKTPAGQAPKEEKATASTAATAKKEKKSGGNKLLLVLLILLALGSGGLGWLLMDQTKQTEAARADVSRLTKEKEKVEADLQAKIDEITALMGEKEGLNSDLAAIKAELEETLADLKKYKATASRVYAAQSRANAATQQYNMLKAQYDSLYAAHNTLTENYTQSQNDLKAASTKNEELTQENTQLQETVETGQVLVAYNLQANGIQVKNSGREKVRDKAKKVNKIEACFMLGKNAIAEQGSKAVHLRIIAPDGMVLAEGAESNQFESNGEQLLYTSMKEINYTGEAEDLCMSFKGPEEMEFKPGTYNVEVYVEGVKIGESSVSLE